MTFEPKLFESPTDLRWFGFVVVFEYARGKFFDFHLVLFGDLVLNLQNASILILFVDFGIENPEINRWFVFLLLNRFITLEILSLFFFSTLGFLWSCWIRCFWQWIQCLNCRNTGSVMKIQLNLWELHVNSVDFGSICFWNG